MEEHALWWLMGTNAPVRQDLWERTVNSGVNVSLVPARMGVLVMTLDKVTSAHAQKDSEERTARNRTSVIQILAEMEALARG